MSEAKARRPVAEMLSRIDPSLLRLLLFFGALTLVLVVLIVFDEIFGPLLVGLGIAYLFDPAVSWFERKGRSRVFGVIAIALLLVIVLAAFFAYVVPAIGEQVQRLTDNFPAYKERIKTQFLPWLADLRQRFPEQYALAEERLKQSVTENLPNLAGTAGKLVGNVASSAVRVILVVLNLIFVPVFAFYLLVDLPKIKAGARDLIPIPYRSAVIERLSEVDRAVAAFLRGQLTIALILGAINATGLAMLGVPMGILLGLVAGLANMVPYMALVVGLVPALLLCWAEYQELWRLLAVVGVFAGAQMLEGTVLSPRILGKSVDLHPVWILLAVIAGGSLFGFIGMLLAVPTAAAIQVFTRHWLKLYRESRIYLGDGKQARR